MKSIKVEAVDLEVYNLCMVKDQEIVLVINRTFLKKEICLSFLRG